jgi:hypothetical protein
VTNKMMELDPETWAEMLKSDDIRVGSEVMFLLLLLLIPTNMYRRLCSLQS